MSVPISQIRTRINVSDLLCIGIIITKNYKILLSAERPRWILYKQSR